MPLEGPEQAFSWVVKIIQYIVQHIVHMVVESIRQTAAMYRTIYGIIYRLIVKIAKHIMDFFVGRYVEVIISFVASTSTCTFADKVLEDKEPCPVERCALEALYKSADGDDWAYSTNWLTNLPLGRWHGVTTDTSGLVVGLDLSNNRLDGKLPPELDDLANLAFLSLGGNDLDGPIPPRTRQPGQAGRVQRKR